MLCYIGLHYTTLQHIPLNLSKVRKQWPTRDTPPWWALSPRHMSCACMAKALVEVKLIGMQWLARDAARLEAR